MRKYCLKRFLFSFLFFASSVQAQKGVQWDTTNVTLANVEIDSVHVLFSDKPGQRLNLTNHGASVTLKATKPGQRIIVPDTMSVRIDTTNVSGAAADSFRIGWAPYDPISGAVRTGDIVYVLAGASTFAALSDGVIFGLPLKPYANAYVLMIWRGDLTVAGSQRVKTSFIRKE